MTGHVCSVVRMPCGCGEHVVRGCWAGGSEHKRHDKEHQASRRASAHQGMRANQPPNAENTHRIVECRASRTRPLPSCSLSPTVPRRCAQRLAAAYARFRHRLIALPVLLSKLSKPTRTMTGIRHAGHVTPSSRVRWQQQRRKTRRPSTRAARLEEQP